MKIIPDTFYVKLKNEDAVPYCYGDANGGLVAVADGLGGSGSFVHRLSEKDYERLEKDIVSIVLPEYSKGALTCADYYGNWLKALFAPMTDKEPDTSALWGSRIVLSRFIYYLTANKGTDLKSEESRQNIVNFIYKGVERAAKVFSLKTDSSYKLVLPTTLACAKYSFIGNDKIRAEVLWAGDSRVYAYIPGEGLKQLTEDDENSSGAITNLFAVKEGKIIKTRLNYREFILPGKCFVFACSDGLFDPYAPIDNIGLESGLLQAVIKGSSFRDFGTEWRLHYEQIASDDCSLASVLFGYDTYDDLKKDMLVRSEKINGIYTDYHLYKTVMSAVNGEENPEEYIRERTEMRRAEIAKLISDELISNPYSSDESIPPVFKERYAKEIENARKIYIKHKKRAEKKICKSIRKYFAADYRNALEDLNSASSKNPELMRAYQLASVCREKCISLNNAVMKGDEIALEIKDSIKDNKALIRKLDISETQLKNVSTSANKGIKRALEDAIFNEDELKKFLNLWENKKADKSIQHISKCNRELYDRIKRALKSYQGNDIQYQKAVEKYCNYINNLPDEILIMTETNPSVYYSDKLIGKIDFDLLNACDAKWKSCINDTICSLLSEPYILDAFVHNIISASSVTVADRIYNASRLEKCRIFSRVNKDDVIRVMNEINSCLYDSTDISKISIS